MKMNILKTQSRVYLLTPARHFSACCQNAARINHDDETYESSKSQNRNRNSKSLKKIYSEAWSFPSNHELLAHLADNVIHIDRGSGLVVINKPYGLALKPTAEVPVCLEKCLKEFSKVIGVKNLEVLKTAPRFVFKIYFTYSSHPDAFNQPFLRKLGAIHEFRNANLTVRCIK